MVRLLSVDYSETEYVEHLSRLLGFYEPFEAALATAMDGGSWPTSPSRSDLLRRDLADLGVGASAVRDLPRCGSLPLVSDETLPGCLYVYEGASLGGQVISRHLRRSLGGTRALAFYHCDAGTRERQWKAFCASLERTRIPSLDAAAASAVSVFLALGDWMAIPNRTAALTP
jgi:heme oxygenase